MCEPVFGQYFLEGSDARRHVFELDPRQQGEPATGKMPYHSWAKTMTLPQVCSMSWRRYHIQPTALPPVAILVTVPCADDHCVGSRKPDSTSPPSKVSVRCRILIR
jgi:hypothetical protein